MTRASTADTTAPSWSGVDSVTPSGLRQWLALTERVLTAMLKHGELIIALIVPLVFTLSFYLPLRYAMKVFNGGIDYAQFVMPIIVLQTMGFTAMAAAARSAIEAKTGLTARLQTMPVAPLAPLAARMAGAMFRSVAALLAAIGYGYVIGFRFSSFEFALYFCLFALAVGLVLSLGSDAIGTLAASPQAVSQAMTLPYLILGMLSSGFTPVHNFPDWIEPFVRNQPISQFSYAMRALADGDLGGGVLLPGLAWLVGLAIVLVPLAVWAGTRRG